jgi:hypothetical protein
VHPWLLCLWLTGWWCGEQPSMVMLELNSLSHQS